jgi:hypothetical protein
MEVEASSGEMSISAAVKRAVFSTDSERSLSKRCGIPRTTFCRFVERFRAKFGSSLEEVISRAGLSVASASSDDDSLLRARRLEAIFSADFDAKIDAAPVGPRTYISAEDEAQIQKTLSFCGYAQCPQNFHSATILVEETLKSKPVRARKDGRLVRKASRHLVSNILRRGDLTLRTPEKLEIPSSGGLSKAQVRKYASALGALLETFSPHSFSGDNVWNLDETGFCAEGNGRQLSVYHGGQKNCQKTQKATGDRVSAMYAVSASGRLGPVALVVPRKMFTQSFVEMAAHICPDWLAWGNEKGWFALEEFRRYIVAFATFLDSFRPPTRTDIILMDNLGTHLNDDTISLMRSHRLEPIYLPPRSTSILQPLDVCLYGPLKSHFFAFRDEFTEGCIRAQLKGKQPEEWDARTMIVPEVTFWDIPKFLKPASVRVFTPERIQKAFDVCGVFPLRESRMIERLPAWVPEEGDAAPPRKRRKNPQPTVRSAGEGEPATFTSYLERLAKSRGK